jgi:hypothetical protein
MGLSFEEHDRRVQFAMDLYTQGLSENQVKRALMREFGVKFRQAGRYMERARKRFQQSVDKPVEQQRAQALRFFVGMAFKARSDRDKIRAYDSVCRLLGLNAPTEISGPGGGSIKFSLDQLNQTLEDAELELAQKALPVVAKIPHALPEEDLDSLLKEMLPNHNATPGAAHGSEAGS